ncbi:MAG: ubiquitin-like domain-containing protein, partial [Actinomycetota bacterium]|nr:ubiquitin-like domain-containing protein [Actinomycetota bacterium]
MRVRKAIERTTLVGVILAGGLLYIVLQKNITLVVDGRARPVATFDSSVGELLQVRGISLHPGDQVMPSPATSLADGMVVVVDREVLPAISPSAPVSPSGGVWAVGGVSGALREELLAPAETALSADAPTGASRIVDARVVVMGKVRDVLTNAKTVGALLSAMGIKPDRRDRVLPPPSTPLSQGDLVRYADVDTRVKKVTAPIPYGTFTTYSHSLAPGHIDVVHKGEPGRFLRTYRLRSIDGRVVARHRIGQRVLKEAKPEHRVVGSTAPTPPAPAPVTGGGSGSSGGSGVQVGDASWYSFAPGSGLTAA